MRTAIIDGVATPASVAADYLERINALNPRLRAFISIDIQGAREATEALGSSAKTEARCLAGVPLAIKDVFDVEGSITTGGSAAFRKRRSNVTATAVRRLLEQGMVPLGKTNTVELAYGSWGENEHFGTPWNPWNATEHHAPGGSSSGSAVAVAAGLSPCAIGTDTGGSVRIPASFCGITALKPTFGAVSTFGIIPLSTSLDTVGPMARHVEDVDLLFRLLRDGPDNGGGDVFPRLSQPSGPPTIARLRLGRMPDSERANVHADVLSAYDESLALLEDLGAEIVDVRLPFDLMSCNEAQDLVSPAEGYATHRTLIDDPATPLSDYTRDGLRAGGSLPAYRYIEAQRLRVARMADLQSSLRGLHALLTPTTESVAPPLGAIDRNRMPLRFTRFVNFLGLCALALPNGFSREGLPTSLQIVCAAGQEEMALRIGRAFQQATSWHLQTPAWLSSCRPMPEATS